MGLSSEGTKSEAAEEQEREERPTQEHILVCLSSAPSNPRIIRTGAKMAAAFHGKLTALYVKTPDYEGMSRENKRRLQESVRLAESLGAAVETTYGENVSDQIAEFARLAGVTKIVIGRSNVKPRHFFGKPNLTDRLIAIAPNLDIHIIPDAFSQKLHQSQQPGVIGSLVSVRDLGKTLMVLALATAVGTLFYYLGFTEVNIVTVYLLGVLLTSLVTTGWLCSLLSSVISVLVFGYFFTIPRFTFRAYGKGYPVTFAIMFLAAIITGTLASKLKNHAKESARAAYRSRILFDVNQFLQKAEREEDMFKGTGEHLARLLQRRVCVYRTEEGTLSGPEVYVPDGERNDESWPRSERERRAAGLAFEKNKRAGASTELGAGEEGLYLPIRAGGDAYGVVGIYIGQEPLEASQQSMVLSVLGECALALENKKNAREKEQAALLAKSEQLRANLLRSISHDLRTPLTSISGNASNLMTNGSWISDQEKTRIYTDIYDDSMWLIKLVENLLAVTRIENGEMKLNRSAELVDEIIAEALRHTGRRGAEHVIEVKESPDLLMVHGDGRLLVQVVINLVDNAIKYTQPGSKICIFTEKQGDRAAIHVADNGPGIPKEQREKIFEMFYTGTNGIADSRRSLGLGLFLCRSIAAAHKGTLTVSDNQPQGAVFTLTLPCEEVKIHG